MSTQELEKHIRDVPDFPKVGIVFKDITPLVAHAQAFSQTIGELKRQVAPLRPDVLLGIESRGFIFGGALACAMNLGLLMARKPGKLPYKKDSVSYSLEYGTNTLELHQDAIRPGQRVLIIDDLLATGGTAQACVKLIERQKGVVAGSAFVIELGFLNGRKNLAGQEIVSLLQY